MQPSNEDEKFNVDLTLANAKNISLEDLLAGDSRLLEAHRKAVSRTIDLIESRYAQTQINGQPVGIDNLTAAKYHHAPSRQLAPQLHTHCLALVSEMRNADSR